MRGVLFGADEDMHANQPLFWVLRGFGGGANPDIVRRLIGAAVLGLAGCVAQPIQPPERAVFRDTTAAFSSRAGGLPAASVRFVAAGDAMVVERGFWALVPGRYSVTGPGRMARKGGPDVWVLWVDDGFRTAAIGTPDGRFGWIMDRSATPAPDRLKAAREILEWQGYDLSQLRKGAR